MGLTDIQRRHKIAAAAVGWFVELASAWRDDNHDAAAKAQRELQRLGAVVRFTTQKNPQAKMHVGPASRQIDRGDIPRAVRDDGEPLELVTATKLAEQIGTNARWIIERAEGGAIPHFIGPRRTPLFDPVIAERAITKLSIERMKPPESPGARKSKPKKERPPNEQHKEG